ncbi:unnamed protein product [Vitrella brassicaformis CCMP3155]|uniref:C3H1-type domain-containing protein n=2 Tax=Vitrella brassicaformis TaxID=1169539 RepID=A0A0G4GH55_VITBC|nr:unnamed protein product [Vitrella brassicaformis CCMP3155]|eukprot:CEM29091.1 unnamed protein product [Vitrella brassicaformis CCMP3155]
MISHTQACVIDAETTWLRGCVKHSFIHIREAVPTEARRRSLSLPALKIPQVPFPDPANVRHRSWQRRPARRNDSSYQPPEGPSSVHLQTYDAFARQLHVLFYQVDPLWKLLGLKRHRSDNLGCEHPGMAVLDVKRPLEVVLEEGEGRGRDETEGNGNGQGGESDEGRVMSGVGFRRVRRPPPLLIPQMPRSPGSRIALPVMPRGDDGYVPFSHYVVPGTATWLEDVAEDLSKMDHRDTGHPLKCPGSLLHNVGACKPCVFYWGKGCQNGRSCQFCHEWHPPGKRSKTSKKRGGRLYQRPSLLSEDIPIVRSRGGVLSDLPLSPSASRSPLSSLSPDESRVSTKAFPSPTHHDGHHHPSISAMLPQLSPGSGSGADQDATPSGYRWQQRRDKDMIGPFRSVGRVRQQQHQHQHEEPTVGFQSLFAVPPICPGGVTSGMLGSAPREWSLSNRSTTADVPIIQQQQQQHMACGSGDVSPLVFVLAQPPPPPIRPRHHHLHHPQQQQQHYVRQ